jgi:hypothetical protein
MKNRIFTSWRVTMVLLLGASTVSLVQAEGLVMPAEPQVLLKALPGPSVTGWKTTKSVGESRYSSWLKSSATREYEKTVLAEGDDPSRPPTTRFTIVDSGRYPGLTAVFHNFEPGEYDDFKVTTYNSYPAVVIEGGSQGMMIKTLVDDRFIVELLLKGQDLSVVKDWMEASKLEGLANLPEVGADKVPELVMNIIIDELNPELSRSYESATIGSDEIAELIAGDNEEMIEKGYAPAPEDEVPDEEDDDEGGDAADERPAKPGEVKPR